MDFYTFVWIALVVAIGLGIYGLVQGQPLHLIGDAMVA